MGYGRASRDGAGRSAMDDERPDRAVGRDDAYERVQAAGAITWVVRPMPSGLMSGGHRRTPAIQDTERFEAKARAA